MIRFILFQGLIIIPFISASLAKRFIPSPSALGKKAVRFNIIFLEPLIVLWSIWGLQLHPGHAVLPLAGLLMVLAGFGLGLITSPLTRLQGGSRKVYIISTSLANHGFTMGGLICFLLYGEKGLGLASIFIIYFMFYTYIFIFSYAKYKRGDQLSLISILKEYLFSLQNMPMFAAGAALILNTGGVPRPEGFPPFQNLIFVSVPLYYFSLGLNFSFREIFHGGAVHLIYTFNKFIALPVLTLICLSLFTITGEIRAVIMIQSFMPAAIYSMISAVLFDLDLKLAGSLFVVNSLIFMAVVLPILFLLKNFI